MNHSELEIILENHKHWLKADCYDWEHMRADLSGVNLIGANLSGVDLTGADLSGAYLVETNLYRANLSRADLSGAFLVEANLYGANLNNANLSWANLCKAGLSDANLCEAWLVGAKLIEASLNLANLNYANLCKADLHKANLSGANLSGAINVPEIPYACPDTGSFIGWKKARGTIVCLEIPEDAKRSSSTGRKCRCNKAKVLSITNLDGSPCEFTAVPSNRDSKFIYKVGEVVSVDNFDENRWHECAPGIHFFINRHEAVEFP